MMIGEPNYWAPGDFASHDPAGSITNLGLLPGLCSLRDPTESPRVLLPTAEVGHPCSTNALERICEL